jgi:hypothetical protein
MTLAGTMTQQFISLVDFSASGNEAQLEEAFGFAQISP